MQLQADFVYDLTGRPLPQRNRDLLIRAHELSGKAGVNTQNELFLVPVGDELVLLNVTGASSQATRWKYIRARPTQGTVLASDYRVSVTEQSCEGFSLSATEKRSAEGCELETAVALAELELRKIFPNFSF